MDEQPIGTVSHFWGNLHVAGVELAGDVARGDTVHFLGNTTDFVQMIESMQIGHEAVESAGTGDSVGIKVDERVRVNDQVFLVTAD